MAIKRIPRKTGPAAVRSFHPDTLRVDNRKGHPPLVPGGKSGWQPVGGGGSGPTTTTTTSTTTTTTTTT
jgi:hypothetical protein